VRWGKQAHRRLQDDWTPVISGPDCPDGSRGKVRPGTVSPNLAIAAKPCIDPFILLSTSLGWPRYTHLRTGNVYLASFVLLEFITIVIIVIILLLLLLLSIL
jgi:hypothetical protein